ncbi:hypothetical protein [uncultured Mailhella sp.]|uniref:hypothetical protein n=1 Tax=uncultured Mailhella sp. TaxID=1981031 RepID=UPI00320A6032
MASSSRSFRKLAACVLVLCCLGGAAWYFLPEKVESTVESARNAVRHLTGETTEKTGDAGTPAEVSSAAGEENSPRQVGAALTTEGRPAPVDPQAELLARVDRAMTLNGAAAPDGDSASGKVTDQAPAPAAEHRDSVVTPRFVSDMAGWLASKYIPSHHEGRGGRSAVTLVQANARYSNSGTLRSVERDPLKSRSSILNYVFTPGMLEALYRMYSPAFIEEMERSARASRRTPLTDAQVADMFEVYAEKFCRLAVSLEASSAVDLPALSAAILREAGHESEANESFARAYMALSLAREHGDRDEIAIQSRRMAESTRVAGMYADRQERARNDMVYAIRRKAEGQALSSAELLFLGEWLSRRRCSVESMQAAADVCRRMAEQMSRRADDILHHRESDMSAPASSEAGKSAGPGTENAASPASTTPSAAPEAANPAIAVGSASARKAAAEAGKSSDAPSSASSATGKSSSPAGKPSFPEVSGRLNRNAPASAAQKAPAEPLSASGRAESSTASPQSSADSAQPAATEPTAAPAAQQKKPAAGKTPAPSAAPAATSAAVSDTASAAASAAPSASTSPAATKKTANPAEAPTAAPAAAQSPATTAETGAPAGSGQNDSTSGSGNASAAQKAPAEPLSASGRAESSTASPQSSADSAQPAATEPTAAPAAHQEKPAAGKTPAPSAAPVSSETSPAAAPSAASAATSAAVSDTAPAAASAAPSASTSPAATKKTANPAEAPTAAPAAAQSPATTAETGASAGSGQNAAR